MPIPTTANTTRPTAPAFAALLVILATLAVLATIVPAPAATNTVVVPTAAAVAELYSWPIYNT